MTSNNNQPRKYLLSRREVAELFGVSPSTIDRWRADRILPFIKVGTGHGKNKTIRYPMEKIQEFINENTIATKSELMDKYDL